MANNFNASDFMKGIVYAPIELGEHDVTITKAKPVFETDDNGNDKSYLVVTIVLENGREINQRFYANGIEIFTNQIRKQIEQNTDVKFADFLKSLKDLKCKCWISKRTYVDKNDNVKTTLQYDFTAPKLEDLDEDLPQ